MQDFMSWGHVVDEEPWDLFMSLFDPGKYPPYTQENQKLIACKWL